MAELEKTKSNRKKRLLIIVVVIIFLVGGSWLAYNVYDFYDSQFTYSYGGRIFLTGKHKGFQPKFRSLRIDFQSALFGSKDLHPKDFSVKIDGKFYNLAELTYDKIKDFKNYHESKFSSNLQSLKGGGIVFWPPEQGYLGIIQFDYKDSKLHDFSISVNQESKYFSPEIKFKNNTIKLPVTLNDLNKTLPGFKIHSKASTPFSGRISWIFQ